MDGKKRIRLSGAEYRKRAKEKDDKQKDTIKKTRKLDDFFGKPSTDIKYPIIDATFDVPSSSGTSSTVDSAVSSTDNTLIDMAMASISKEQAEDVPLVPGVAGVGVQPSPPDQELDEISDDPAKWTIDEFTRDYFNNFFINIVEANTCLQSQTNNLSDVKSNDNSIFLKDSIFEASTLRGPS
ncbi:hypothetical protein PYW08_009972 [Mythimna loreyi]|uniref:Uncharacterized protein n=1 Tax=Mythimna loreyi TaxID=667449 RepID=A0ACC2Q8T4_9NEOP|nr:hypothetical protein PYW08_009972 [Mythimna loreyi]